MLRSKLPRLGTTIFTQMSALAAAHDAINLSQGFPDFDAPPALLQALSRHTMAGHNQYAPMAGVPELREQIARHVIRYRQVSCDPEAEITVVPGATEGIFCAIMACVHRGDEVIVLDPCYDSYGPGIELAGGKAVHVPLTAHTFSIDWQRVEDAVTQNTRMVIINSPHNPSGAVLSRQDLVQLEALAELHDLLIISDEVYEHLVFDDHVHHSVLQFPALRQRSFAVFSFGKTFSVTGWKTGYCIAPPELSRELRKVHQFVSFVAVTPVQRALADFMATEPDYAAGLQSFYQDKRNLFCRAVTASRFTLRPSAGTYFQLLDYSEISSETDTVLAKRWTETHRVAAIPVSVFYAQQPDQQVLRFCFAKRDEVLEEAGRVLCEI
ncbi:MAG: methionine aminotransferase [Pseudomonadota bacterium]